MGTPHDALFHATFSQLEHARSLLLFVLPPKLRDDIDWATLQPVPTKQTGSNLRLHHEDLLFVAKRRRSNALVYFLIEHKSGRVRGLARQMHCYIMHVTGESLRSKPALPYVVPVVVHHGRRPMSAATWRPQAPRGRMGTAAAIEGLSFFDPRLEFVVDELTGGSEADLLARPLTPLARLTLLCLQFVPGRGDDAAIAALERWTDLVREVGAGPGGQFALETISSYFLHVTNLSLERLDKLFARIAQQLNENLVMSTASRLRAEGKVEGKTEGKAEIILRMLTARFGPPPTDIESRVRSAAADQLDRWAIAILDAKSLAEVFAGRG